MTTHQPLPYTHNSLRHDEFLRVARKEIQTEIDFLKKALLACVNDEQFYKESRDIEKHMHKIKGLAPMMQEEKVGEIAQVSNIILKHITNHGPLKGSHAIILESVHRMDHLFNADSNIETSDFRKKAIAAYPDITGF